MKVAMDSNSLPAATRRDTWRGLLCDTYMGIDCDLPDEFRSVIEGYAIGEHTLTRITSSKNAVDRSPTLIKRDGLELVFFGILLAGRATTLQGGRETPLERGSVVVSDTSRPFRTHVDEAADIIWLSVPKKPIADRVRGIEDLVAISLRPTRPLGQIAIDLMRGLEEAQIRNLPAHELERLTTQIIDLLALTITSTGLPPTLHLMPRRPFQQGLQVRRRFSRICIRRWHGALCRLRTKRQADVSRRAAREGLKGGREAVRQDELVHRIELTHQRPQPRGCDAGSNHLGVGLCPLHRQARCSTFTA